VKKLFVRNRCATKPTLMACAVLGVACHAGVASAADQPARVAQIDVSPKVTPLPGPNAKPPTTAPGEVPPVPDPNLLVLGGTPQNPDFAVKPLVWKWKRFTTADYVVTASAGAITLASALFHPISQHSLTGPILFDKSARDALRSSSAQTRYTFRDASDVGLSLEATWPFFVDSLITAWWYRGSRDAAQEMALVDLEALAISGAIQGATNVLVSRERPYGSLCGTSELPNTAIDCQGTAHYRSFFSGHSAFSFTTAALLCLDHEKNELLGEPWDALTCGGGYVAAAFTASSRVAADMHYSSDVLTGAVVGTLVGYGVPWLHYKRQDLGVVRAGTLKMSLFPTANGAGVVGTF
jgi:membrane-associated phospholipid phosphatase